MTYAQYSNHVIVISIDEEIQLIAADKGFTGAMESGLAAGATAADVIDTYGPPARIVQIGREEGWIYDAVRLAIRMDDGRIVGWSVYF